MYLVRGREPKRGPAQGSSFALSFIVGGQCRHNTVNVDDDQIRVNGKPVPELGTTLQEAVPILVAQCCKTYGVANSEPVLNTNAEVMC